MKSALGDPLTAQYMLAEDNRQFFAELLRRGEKLSEIERYVAAFLIDGEAIPPKKKKDVGRPRKTRLSKTDWRDISIAIEYELSYEHSASDGCFKEIQEKYGFSFSTAHKAVKRGRKLLGPYLDKVIEKRGVNK